jgi:hypothetical protein
MEGVPFVRCSDSPKGCLATFSFGVAVIATTQPEVIAPQKKDLAEKTVFSDSFNKIITFADNMITI